MQGRLAALGARARDNVWTPVVAKAIGILLLMSGLGGIGAASTLAEAGQLPNELGVFRALVAHERTLLASSPAGSSRARPATAVPVVPPSAPGAPDAPRDAGAPRSSAITPDGKVILNLATVEDLRRLPGVGPKRAQQIVALRDKLKRFRRLTDLLRVKGIGPKRLQKLLPKLVLDPPPAGDAGTS